LGFGWGKCGEQAGNGKGTRHSHSRWGVVCMPVAKL